MALAALLRFVSGAKFTDNLKRKPAGAINDRLTLGLCLLWGRTGAEFKQLQGFSNKQIRAINGFYEQQPYAVVGRT